MGSNPTPVTKKEFFDLLRKILMAIKRYTRYKRDKRKVKIQERAIVLAPDVV